MTKHKTSELEGVELDAAVAKAEGLAFWVCRDPDAEGGRSWIEVESALPPQHWIGPPFEPVRVRIEWEPSRYWIDGGPIIDREHIDLEWEGEGVAAEQRCTAAISNEVAPGGHPWHVGPTQLVAAMRAYVASKFGAEIDLP